jgi:hypothetical protein
MTFMIIETYQPGKTTEIYNRFQEKGRMLPEGVHYINSWVTEDLRTCYQLMEAGNIESIREWISHWNDLVDFEVRRVISSAEAAGKAAASPDT